ncbi:Hypothetical protein AAM4_0743 [Actinomyces succiniciruminis]|uniref:Uncharacterized protein n=1 Tax=Actinomyces succiniciruminis TaxID=1522002 RepID=A0A1L7R9Q3_9ACTO|nr:Hypothetical protein AAM4_0743 [Actinomyces succiniciruminis]
MGELGRVAHVLGGDGVHALLEQLVVGAARQHDAEAQLGEDREPQRVVLVHAQHPGYADLAAGVLPLAQAPVGEGAPVLVVVQVGHVGLGLAALLGGATLAAVAGHVPLAVVEGGDGQLAVVLAQLAHRGLGGEAEAGQLGQAHQRAGDAVVGLVGGQGGAEAAHEAGDVGADDLAPGEQLEGAQHGVVEEGAALNADALAQLGGVAQLDDLVQGVAHHRVGQSGADVAGGGVLLLGLLDRGVHEHGAAAAQVHGTVRGQRGGGELLDGLAHGLGEGLQEGAAAGGAGLVYGDGVDGAAADAQVLHVLPADVDDAGDAGVQVGGGPVVGHGLHHALVDAQRGLDDALAVAGDAGADDAHVLGHLQVDAAQDLDGGGDGVALVAGVVLPDDAVLLVDDDGLDGGGAGVDAQEAVLVVGGGAVGGRGVGGRGGPADPLHGGLGVAGAEGGEFGVVGEQGAHAAGARAGGAAGGEAVGDLGQRRRLPVGQEGGADGDVQLGVVGAGEGVDLVGQGALEGPAQLGQEVQRAAQEHDVAADGAAAGQAGDGLGDHGLEHGGGQVLAGGALVDQRLQVGLGEHAAARGDRVEGLVFGGEFVQAGGVGVQQLRHLVDEGAGAARAGAVHALLGGGVQVGDLGVLAAELDDDIGLGVLGLDGAGLGDDLLHEGQAHQVGQVQAGAAGDSAAHARAREGGVDLGQ